METLPKNQSRAQWQYLGEPQPVDLKGPLFSEVKPSTILGLCSNAKKFRAAKSREVYHPDSERNASIYIVVSGAFRVSVEEGQVWKTLSIRREGEFFGESENILSGTFNGRNNRARVISEIDSEVIEIPWNTFQAYMFREGEDFDFALNQAFIVSLQELIIKRTEMYKHATMTTADHIRLHLRDTYELLKNDDANPVLKVNITKLTEEAGVTRFRIYQLLKRGANGRFEYMCDDRTSKTVRILDLQWLLAPFPEEIPRKSSAK